MTKADDIALAEAPYGSELYAQSLRLREAILRKPLGLTLSAEELADDVPQAFLRRRERDRGRVSVLQAARPAHAAAQADGGGGGPAG